MSYKKFLSATALATLLSLSNTAFSDPVSTIEEDDEETSFYLSLHGSIDFGNIGELKMKGQDKKDLISKIFKDNQLADYQPKYKASILNGGAAVGYRMGNMRVELEGFYSGLKPDEKDDKSDDGYVYVGVDESLASTITQKITGVQNPQSALAAKEAEADLVTAKNTLSAEKEKILKVKNEGFSTGALMVNGYYDVDLGEDSPIGFYAGLGLGAAKVTFLESEDKGFMDNVKPAGQLRAGGSYAFSPTIKLYGGLRYFGVFSDEFKNIRYNKKDQTNSQQQDNNTMKNSYGVVSLEAGVMFNF
jgi:hypothetical protein